MDHPSIEIKVKDTGLMRAELYPEFAPATVANFLSLVEKRFFDGLIFHRVIEGFMIQGGGYDASFRQKDADTVKGEFASNGFPQNTLRHTRGVLSMARASNPDSAGSQFFIMHADAPYLDGNYAAFGEVVEGMDVVDEIAAVRTDFRDMPAEPQIMKTVEIIPD